MSQITVTPDPICLLEVVREHPQKSGAPEDIQAPNLGGPAKIVLVCGVGVQRKTRRKDTDSSLHLASFLQTDELSLETQI
jgi:hypothetical protein